MKNKKEGNLVKHAYSKEPEPSGVNEKKKNKYCKRRYYISWERCEWILLKSSNLS